MTRDLTTWLGDTTPTDDQLDALNAAADEAERIYPINPDHTDDEPGPREQILSGAAQVILGNDTLDGLAREHGQAKSAERDAMDRLRGAIIAAAHAGTPETEIARRAGVTRMTVRATLGK